LIKKTDRITYKVVNISYNKSNLIIVLTRKSKESLNDEKKKTY